MSYNNRNYNRTPQLNSRYNTSGSFVPAGELNSPSTPSRTTRSTAAASFTNMGPYPVGTNPPAPPQPPQLPMPTPPPLAVSAQQFQAKAALLNYGNTEPNAIFQKKIGAMQLNYDNTKNSCYGNNVEMPLKVESMEVTTDSAPSAADNGGEARPRPPWMKTGIKKLSTKERRRRQNEHLRKLLTPKNALMVLNEMMPGEQLSSNFTVEAAPPSNLFFRQEAGHKFCAGLVLDGQLYKGFGENKLTARNAAAEQAIRDLVIKRMSKALASSGAGAGGADAADNSAEGTGDGESVAEGSAAPSAQTSDSDSLPMIQLASYALHKLFSEWQYEGFQVPLLKRSALDPSATSGQESSETLVPTAPKPKPAKKAKELPENAGSLHPSMLLTQMRPSAIYNELGCEGDKPQNMIFTMGVTVDGTTYIGKASNKKEARKQAARSACMALFNVQFEG